ncbi:hypothetical protein BUALT_Bualt11G0079200 [Buddleja alternifolia]|uniref:Ribosomal RNA-processing protein 14 N-terminal domain-containing protein n=1 Tax=Buddleja alternifolia TaxID=168488 RepID=A0AAV6X0L9_9LAMI|nr:hypothetical protein BUALT_Bualt11G0079200 [Buddleja alternifolia]
MKKKKSASATTAAAAAVVSDLKSSIHSHNEFFDHLIELIPPRFYLSNDDAESKPWYQGLSKAAKASLKQQSKQNLKIARRNRFDPDSKQQQPIGKSTDEIRFVNVEENGEIRAKEEDKDKSVTYEELRQKLRRKIELLRGNRGEKKFDEKRVKFDGKKRKRDGEDDVGETSKGASFDEDEDGEEIIEYGKREKKLMRPGFEGRKDGFITKE